MAPRSFLPLVFRAEPTKGAEWLVGHLKAAFYWLGMQRWGAAKRGFEMRCGLAIPSEAAVSSPRVVRSAANKGTD